MTIAQTTRSASSLNDSSTPIALSVSLYGPMLLDFLTDALSVDIYVPYCPYHLGAFYFDSSSYSETVLWEQAIAQAGGKILDPSLRAYNLHSDGVVSSAVRPARLKSPGLEGPAPLFQPEKVDLLHCKVLFKITVPRPEFIQPLYSDSVQIIKSVDFTPDVWNIFSHYATGFRFYYRWDSTSPVLLDVPAGGSVNITPPVPAELSSEFGPSIPNIDIRYQGLGILDPNDIHSDARACFASLVSLAGLTSWLNYGDGKGSPTNLGPNPPLPITGPRQLRSMSGADCHAPIIVNNLDSL